MIGCNNWVNVYDPCINRYDDDDYDDDDDDNDNDNNNNNNNNNSNKMHTSLLKVVMYAMTVHMLRPTTWLTSGR